ncbi:MAG: B12-binding domain-containing radical SAM protein [Thermincolia bacterium]
MNILLTTLNSKYIHSNLAVRYLAVYCHDQFPKIQIREFTINAQLGQVAGEIYGTGVKVVGFSCYIWNIEATLKLVEVLKKVEPDMVIILGGPEVSYEVKELMEQNLGVDYVISGEGEKPLKELLLYIREGRGQKPDIPGVSYRYQGEIIIVSQRAEILDLDEIPSPYQGSLADFENKIIYYESSRGCPFKCQYCLSSTTQGLRFFSLERVRGDLARLLVARVKQVKLVDRTFNCHQERTLAILQFLKEHDNGLTNFHLEVAADLFDHETIEFLGTLRPGLVQLEIGVQSTNPETLAIIRRKMDIDKVQEAVRAIREKGNIHLHLDLIAGLPGESIGSMAKSFNDVYGLKPDHLQLGFLKLLKGSGLRERAHELGLVWCSYPPYEILATPQLSYDDILRLKAIEEMLEIYYSTHRFDRTVSLLADMIFADPFSFFDNLAAFWQANGWHLAGQGKVHLYRNLWEFVVSVAPDHHVDSCRAALAEDYLENHQNNKLPEWLVVDNKVHC